MSSEEKKQILFIHGGGDGGYEADARLADSLRLRLGDAYHVRYPKMPDDSTSPDFGWGEKIGREIAAAGDELILAGHSLGASMLLKFLSENEIHARIKGIFLLATPFWSGDEDWQKGLTLQEDFAERLPRGVPIFLYYNDDDEEVPASHLAVYARKLPGAVIRKQARGGHQFDNDLAIVAQDISTA